MASVTGSLTLNQLSDNQVAKCYQLESAKKVTFQIFESPQTHQVDKNHLNFSWANIEEFDALHEAVKEILAVE